MAKMKISTEALKLLFASYKAQQEQLTYQLMRTGTALAELERDYGTQLSANPDAVTQSSAGAKPGAKPGVKRSRPSGTASTTGKKRGRKPGATKSAKVPAKAKNATSLAKRRGRPSKSESSSIQQSITTKRTRKISGTKAVSTQGTKSAVTKKFSRKLSDWDQIMVTALQKSASPLRKADLDLAYMRHSLVKKNSMTPEDVYIKVARVIHKLANTRGLIQKVNVEGKGYAYVLPV